MIHSTSCWQDLYDLINSYPDSEFKFKYPSHKTQKRLTYPKGKAPCCIALLLKRKILLTWCRKHGMNPLPISQQTKKLLLSKVGFIELQLIAPSGNSTDKEYRICKQKQANNNQPTSLFHSPIRNKLEQRHHWNLR